MITAAKGDADDVKRALIGLLTSPAFSQTLAALQAVRQDGFMPPLPVTVYQEERMSHIVFPMCELIVYKGSYPEQDILKHIEYTIGLRWTAVAKDERTVTRHVEMLVRATVELLWGATLPGVNSGPILVTEEDYSPLAPARDHPFVKSGLVLVTIPIWRQ